MSELNNNTAPEANPEGQNSENTSGQNADYSQYDNGQQYYNNPQDYNGGQYYGPDGGQPCYNDPRSYGGQQYYNNQQNYDGQQYYGPDNGQYYGQNPGCNGQPYYNNQQDYSGQQYYNNPQNYNSGQYYGPNGGQPYYNNPQNYGGQQYYNNQQNYGGQQYNGQYYGQNPGYNGQPYNNGQMPYANPQAAWQQAQPAREPVTNIFNYILMALLAVSTIVNIAAASSLISSTFSSIDFDALAGQEYMSLYSYMMNSYAAIPGYAAYSALNSLLSIAVLVISIVDIIQVHKKGYPVLGLILFAILFKPGYFIWRAHVTNQKKLVPILFTVSYVLVFIVYFFWCFSFMISLL